MAVTVESFLIDIATDMHGSDAKALQAVGDAANGLLAGLGKLVGLSAGVYGISNAISDFIDDSLQLSRASQATNTSVENLDAWVRAIDSVGEDGARSLETIKGLASDLTEAMMTGDASGKFGFLRSIGIEAIDPATGKLKDVVEILIQLSEKMKGFSNDPAMRLKIGEMFGLDEGTARAMIDENVNLDERLKLLKDLSPITKDTVVQSERIHKNFSLASEAWAVGSDILTVKLLPVLEKITVALVDFSMWIVTDQQRLETFVAVVSALFSSTLWPIISKVGIAFALMGAKIALLVGVFSAVGVAVYDLIQSFAVWDGTISGLGDVWDEFVSRLGGRWEDLKGLWNQLITYIITQWPGASLFLSWGTDGANSLGEGFKSGWETFTTWLSGLYDQIYEMVLGGDFIDIGENAGKAVVDGFRTALNYLHEVLESIDYSAILNGVMEVVEKIAVLLAGIGQALIGFVKGFIEEILNDLWKSINSVLSYIGLGTEESERDPKSEKSESASKEDYRAKMPMSQGWNPYGVATGEISRPAAQAISNNYNNMGNARQNSVTVGDINIDARGNNNTEKIGSVVENVIRESATKSMAFDNVGP